MFDEDELPDDDCEDSEPYSETMGVSEAELQAIDDRIDAHYSQGDCPEQRWLTGATGSEYRRWGA